MNIWIYDNILEGMKEYNANHSHENYGNTIAPYPTSNTTYPCTFFDEVRNVALNGNTCHDAISSMGYRVDIQAKTKGNVLKQTIARKVAKLMNDYLTRVVGLKQVSFNVIPQINDNSIYQITMMYESSFHENRARFI